MRDRFPQEIERFRVFGKPHKAGTFFIKTTPKSLVINVWRSTKDNPWERALVHRTNYLWGHYKGRFFPTMTDLAKVARWFWGPEEEGPAVYFNCEGNYMHWGKNKCACLWRHSIHPPTVPPEFRWKVKAPIR